MVNISQLLLLIAVAIYPSACMPCNSECDSACYNQRCQSSSCRSSSRCCGSSCYQTRCSNYQACDKQCCQDSNCCQSNCCGNCCSQPTTDLPPVTPIPPLPPVTPERQVSTESPGTNMSSVSNSNTSITLPINISVVNEFRSESHINIPVNITVYNTNNINITNDEHSSTDNGGSDIINPTTSKTTINTTKIIRISVPYMLTMPIITPIEKGCCNVVQPCNPYSYPGCTVSNNHCSSSCQGNYMYNPIDVCQHGCHYNRYATGLQCTHRGCQYQDMNCFWCGNNFYQTYENFLKCSGCFIPSNWG